MRNKKQGTYILRVVNVDGMDPSLLEGWVPTLVLSDIVIIARGVVCLAWLSLCLSHLCTVVCDKSMFSSTSRPHTHFDPTCGRPLIQPKKDFSNALVVGDLHLNRRVVR